MKLLVFAGAGASAELGVPTMRTLAVELLSHMEDTARDSEFIKMLRTRVEDVSGDLETVVEDIDKLCGVGSVLPAYGVTLDAAIIESARLTRAEIEWFVQHSCERVRIEDAAALWGPLVRKSTELEITVATTNYDRAIEHACQRYGTSPVDGFGSFGDREWASWEGFDSPGLRLLKLHGSTDWYQERASAAVLKLRHPMPLFGGVTLHLDDEGLGPLGSALVMPSREKRKNEPPFPQISHELFSAAKAADVAVFVGTSLRDPDLRSLVAECSRRVPTLVVGPDLSFGTLVPDGAAIVRDLASPFLICVLPRMLTTETFPAPGSVLEGLAQPPESILADVATLRSDAASDDAKSDAIESLWRQSANLEAAELRPLLEPATGQVARDALALVALSQDVEDLKAECGRLAERSSDQAFRDDYDILLRLASGA